MFILPISHQSLVEGWRVVCCPWDKKKCAGHGKSVVTEMVKRRDMGAGDGSCQLRGLTVWRVYWRESGRMDKK